jgi:hypothetical protein
VGGTAGDVRREVIAYMNRRERFKFIAASHVARDLGRSSKGGRRMVREDLDLLAAEGLVRTRIKYAANKYGQSYDVEMYARFAPKISEDAGVPQAYRRNGDPQD